MSSGQPQRTRCTDVPAVTAIMKEHLKTPTQLDTTADVQTDAEAFKLCARTNKHLMCGLRTVSPTLSFARSTLKICLLDLALSHTEWGFTKQDSSLEPVIV